MGLRPGGRFRRVRGRGVDWYAGIRSGGAGLDWETCENGNSGNWWMRCSVMGMAGAWSRISILTRSRDLPRRRRCLRGEQPRVVWNVLCDHMDVPDPQRWGSDHNAPPMPVR